MNNQASTFKMNIRSKLLITILTTVMIIFITVFSYIIIKTQNNAIDDGHKYVVSTAHQYANVIKSELDNDVAVIRTLGDGFSKYRHFPSDQRNKIFNTIMKEILINNEQFVSIWVSWELNAIKENFEHENGRERHTYYRNGNEQVYKFELLEVGEVNPGGIYYDLKSNPRELMTDPYFFSYTDDDNNQLLEASIAIPIIVEGEFVGLAGCDIELERFHDLVHSIHPFEDSYSVLISQTGKIISHPEISLVNTDFAKLEVAIQNNYNYNEILSSGIEFSGTIDDNNGDELFISYVPFVVGNTSTNWFIVSIVPSDVVLAKANRTFQISIIVAILGIILIAIIVWGIARYISKPLVRTTEVLNQLSTGNTKDIEFTEIKSHDELADMSRSVQTLSNALKQSADFATNIGAGNLERRYSPLSDSDVLGNALIQMRDNLLELNISNEKNRWMQSGLVKIGQILQGEKTITELGDQILSALAEILDIQIASLFFKDGENYILSSSYSYSVRKSNLNKFKPGEGLIGQCAKEHRLLVFTDVPNDYVSIKSGLGEIAPKEIIVAPLVYQKNVVAVIEVGTTKEFTKEKIEFIAQISENLALGFTSIQAREEMTVLLEKTQQQAEELQQQQEKLVTANKELEEQTNALKVSEEELQQQQEELRVTNEELEEKTKYLEEQRSEITNKNLKLENIGKNLEQKAKELEIASKYKSEFLANMSHELRTPLNSLLILSGSLSENKEGNLTEDQVESAQIIYKSGNDLLTMINDILDLSKIESGKMDVNADNVEIRSIADNMRDYFKHGVSQKNLSLIIDIDENLPETIITDQQKVEQIVKNFMSNALKFTESGSITMKFAFGQRNDHICISVIDTGIGIPEDKQRLIFEAFQQADGSISRKFGGTGLGLSISRELAKLLGGKITLDSEYGKGSEFSFCFPLENNNADIATIAPKKYANTVKEVKVTEEKTVKETNATSTFTDDDHNDFIQDDFDNLDGSTPLILIVEDDPKFARVLYKQCVARGFQCIASQTGEYGIKLADQLLPKAIILDINLPGIDGWRVLDLLKKNPKTRHIPVHIMSGEEESIIASTKGAIGYLTKPVKIDQLENAFGKIESFIDKKTGNLLVIEDDDNLRKSIKILIGEKDVNITDAATGAEAMQLLKNNTFDCMVLDLGLSDMSGFELIEELNKPGYNRPPIIVYTGKDLTKKENEMLEKYAESIIIKGVKSEERLLDETALFMHRVTSEMPKKQQEVINKIHRADDTFSNKKVLIVDDDMRNVFALTKILTEHKMVVSRAENGKVALDIVNKDPNFDVILMDIMMPEMDGYETMRKMREIPTLSKIPIIALTAKAMKEDRQKCIESGANDYMAKPIIIEKLLSLLRVWLYK